jgi:hypothetical protein
LQVNLEPKIEEIRATVAIPEKAIDVLKSRSDDVYAPASGLKTFSNLKLKFSD